MKITLACPIQDCKRENEIMKKSETTRSSYDQHSSCEDNQSQNRDPEIPSNAIHEKNSHQSNDIFAKQTIETCSSM